MPNLDALFLMTTYEMFTFIESANVRNCKRQTLWFGKKNSI